MAIYFCYYIFIILLFYASGRVCFSPVTRNGELTPGTSRRRSQDKWFVILATAGLVFLMGLRGQNMGGDLISYIPAFNELKTFSWGKILALKEYLNYEKGYVILNRAIGAISMDSQALLFICAALSIIPIGILLYRRSCHPLLSVIIYMGLPAFLLTFSGLRQSIAIGITGLSYLFIQRKQPVFFVLAVLLASYIHSTALTFLLAYPIYWIPVKRRFGFILVAALPIIWILREPIFSILATLIGRDDTPDNNGAFTLFLVFTMIYLFCVFFGDQDDPESNGLRNLFFVACAVQALGGVRQLIIRVGYYYMVYLALLLPIVLGQTQQFKNERQRKFVSVVVAACFLAFGLYSLYRGGISWPRSYPYHFFWQI